MKVTLIPNWRQAHRMWSVRIAAVLSLLSVAQAEILPLVGFAIPPKYFPWVTAVLGVSVIVFRQIRQNLEALATEHPPVEAGGE